LEIFAIWSSEVVFSTKEEGMKLVSVLIAAAVIVFCCGLVLAQEESAEQQATAESALTAETAIGTGVQEREIVGKASTFPADVGKVYFWTNVMGAEEPTVVNHVWYYKGKEMASIELSVRDKSWRTWSYKTILPEWTGEWTVVVTDDMGREVAKSSFTVTEQN
jgi:hypothetical protein